MSRLRRFLADLGPGLILAATGIGVGDMVSATIAGATYGLSLVWALAAGVLIKFLITEGVARWQLATGHTMMEGWRDHLPRASLVAFFAYFVVWSYFVSSALVGASAMVPAAIVPAVPLPFWGLLHALAALAMVLYGTYERVVDVMKWFIGLMFVSVLATNVLILGQGADWSRLAPASEFSLTYTLSLIGGVGGTVTLLSYAYWMREQGWVERTRLGTVRTDLTASFSLVFFFSLSMIFLATQIDWEGRILEEGPRLVLLLADRIGQETGAVGRALFLLGFWGAAYSSVLGVWHGVPYLFDDWIHLWRGEPREGHAGSAYKWYAVYLTVASISALLLRRPVWLVFAYTVVGSVFFPFVIATLLWLNNSPRLIGRNLRSGRATNVVLALALLLFAYLAARTLLA